MLNPECLLGGGDTRAVDCFCAERDCIVCKLKYNSPLLQQCLSDPGPSNGLQSTADETPGLGTPKQGAGQSRFPSEPGAADAHDALPGPGPRRPDAHGACVSGWHADLVLARASTCNEESGSIVCDGEPALRPDVVRELFPVDDVVSVKACKTAVRPPSEDEDRVEGPRWFHALPEDPFELCADTDEADDELLESQILQLDEARARLVSVVKEEEAALNQEVVNGEGSGTMRVLEESYAHLCALEEQLVALQGEQAGCLLPRLASLRNGPEDSTVSPEILHTHTVPITEVQNDIEAWVPPLKEELDSLTETHNAVTKITHNELKDLQASGRTVLVVPSKVVATIKAGTGRKKARIVACGNFLSREKTRTSPTLSRGDVFTSSLDSLSLRLQLALASLFMWSVLAVDVKTAFLTAPIGGGRGDRVVVIKPAKLLLFAGLIEPDQYFRVDRALYGLQESPRDWQLDRDRKLRVLVWAVDGASRCLIQCAADCSMWMIKACEGIDESGQPKGVDSGPPKGILGVYVDDLLITGTSKESQGLLCAIKATWTCSPEQSLEQGTVKFCGLEIDYNAETKCLEIHQAAYIGELANRHGDLKSTALPVFKDGDEPEPNPTVEQIRRAQGLAGELTWISCRSRPDISFSVSKISRILSKQPVAAAKAALQVIGYLIATRSQRLCYGGSTHKELAAHLVHERKAHIVETFTDASFGCESGRSQSGVVVLVGGCVVGWLSLTQPFTTLSTCESELIAACEGLALTQALLPLWKELIYQTPLWIGYTDSVACAAVLLYPSGSWRTKHLRLRARAYQELVESGDLTLTHIPGRCQLADALTKSLARARIADLMRFMNFSNVSVSEAEERASCASSPGCLRMLLVSSLVLPTAAQYEDQQEWSLSLFRWLMLACLLGLCFLSWLLFVRLRRASRLRRLRELVEEVLREQACSVPNPPLNVEILQLDRAAGGALSSIDWRQRFPPKRPTVKSPPDFTSTAVSSSVPDRPFGLGPIPANNRYFGLGPSSVIPKQVQQDHSNPKSSGLGAIPKQVQPDHPNPKSSGLGAIPKQVQPDHPNPKSSGLGAIPKQVQPDHPNPKSFGLGPNPKTSIPCGYPKTAPPSDPNPSLSFGLGPEPSSSSNRRSESAPDQLYLASAQVTGDDPPQQVATPPLENASIADDTPSSDSDSEEYFNRWYDGYQPGDPYDPYADLTPSERAAVDPDRYETFSEVEADGPISGANASASTDAAGFHREQMFAGGTMPEQHEELLATEWQQVHETFGWQEGYSRELVESAVDQWIQAGMPVEALFDLSFRESRSITGTMSLAFGFMLGYHLEHGPGLNYFQEHTESISELSAAGRSSSDPSGHDGQIRGSSEEPSGHLELGDVSGYVLGVFDRNSELLFLYLGHQASEWSHLGATARAFRAHATLRLLASLRDTGAAHLPDGLVFQATFTFAQVGNQHQWMPVSLIAGERASSSSLGPVTESVGSCPVVSGLVAQESGAIAGTGEAPTDTTQCDDPAIPPDLMYDEEAGVLRVIADEDDDETDELDFQVAQAAFLLWQNGFNFDWEQLTEAQQDIYHGLVGEWLTRVHEVD